jgi:hypothetical protein
MASQRKDTDLVSLAIRAERAKCSGDPDGFLSLNFSSSEFAIILGGCVEFHADVPELQRRRIVLKVAQDPSISRPISAKELLKRCSILEQAYLAMPKRPFRLLTEISIDSQLCVPRTIVGGTTITFQPRTIPGFAARSELFADSRGSLGFPLPINYMPVSMLVSARTPDEAAELALSAIDLVRASWNLSLNRGKSWRVSGGRASPVNDIRLSPFHTVHDASGALATPTYWYDPAYVSPAKLFSDKRRFATLLKFASNLRSRLATINYKQEVEAALIRYVRALDSADLNDAFLRLWSLLEHLTDSSHDPYKVTTRRAAFLFQDRERAQLVLAHLTNHRNRFVHAGSDADDIESLVFLLKPYVDQLLLFHIGNSFGFETRRDAASFMDLPTSRADIDLRMSRLRAAREFVSGSSEP